MVKLYLKTLTILLTDIKQGIESQNTLVNNACLNKITSISANIFSHYINDDKTLNPQIKELDLLICGLYDKLSYYFKDKSSNLRKAYVNDLFQQIRSKLMELILFDSESGLKL
jgi:hypothetical protein